MDKMNGNKEKGFTLVELLASIIILSIIIIGILQMFIFSAKTATSNQTKLVTTHLAKATIERVKVDAESFFPFEQITDQEKTFSKTNCHHYAGVDCDLFEVKVNDLNYEIEIKASQDDREATLNLINVVVTVMQPDKKLSSKVEGYVVNE